MASPAIRARAPRGRAGAASVQRDPDILASYLEDAAHYPGGHADAVALPEDEAQVAALLKSSPRVLPVGAQSSLTGGATPMGDLVVSLSRMNRILSVGPDWVRAEAGVTLTLLESSLKAAGKYFPPVPTFLGACVGGIVATNAAGAATFRHGTTRDWVRGLTVVLASGDVLDIERGDVRAHPDGYFDVALADRVARVTIPSYRMPRVPKVSAGYFAAPDMDLVDLFVGSEGTLGVITEVTLRVLPRRPAACLVFVPFFDRARAVAFVSMLRSVDAVAAIEHMDARCLALLREDGADRQFGVELPTTATIALLITLELPPETTPAQAYDDIARSGERDTPLAALCRALECEGVLEHAAVAVPGDDARAAQLMGIREAVPAAVNARVGRAKQRVDTRIAKTAADMIVPFERLGDLMQLYDDEFARRGLDAAVWGHISDGNLHPNVIPRSYGDVESGRAAIKAFGREVIRMGGSPLAEHGVGRNPIKQELLLDLYGAEGIEAMRAVKQTLDPGYKLARGVIFEREPGGH
jgi:D-lactate dehydrogenase (cytochrome)